jgi:hypothetical protein
VARTGVFVRLGRLAAIFGLAVLFVAETPPPASAQGIFDALFGGIRRAMTPPRAPAYSNPDHDVRAGEGSYAGGASSGNCVRLCDGRHFPVNGRGKMSAAEMCRAFCPSAPTQIFSGGNITRAVAPNGQRYSDLPNAFVYRDKLVPGCNCDGKSPTGLVRFEGHDDPTLRPGDIVATGEGLMVYGDGRLAGGYTPISSSPSVSPKLREQLTATRVAPGRSAEEQPDEADGEAQMSRNVDQRAQASR